MRGVAMFIYQAGPLFSEAERMWHMNFMQELLALNFDVFWPGAYFTSEKLASLGSNAAKVILDTNRARIDQADIVFALLDGPQVDDGTAWEIGYAYAHKKTILGLRTDIRSVGDTQNSSVNAMINASVTLFTSKKDILSYLKNLK